MIWIIHFNNLCFVPLEPETTLNLSIIWKRYQIFSGASKEFLDRLKVGIKLIIFKWKNGEKKRIIKFFLYVFVTVVIMFVMIWLGNNLTILVDELIECVKVWYANLNYGIQEIINKIFILLFLIGIMLWVILMAPGNYAAKGNKVEKIKYVVGLIIFEVMLGFMVGMVLFF